MTISLLPLYSIHLHTSDDGDGEVARRRQQRSPLVIFLEEMTPDTLELIRNASWIRKIFNLTDIDPSNWRSARYGTTTLIDRRLPIGSVYRMHYETNMQRDGLFVDLTTRSSGGDGSERRTRLCNTHFESMRADPPLRPAQVGIVAEQLHMPEVHGGLIAGDFNPIQDFDRTFHTQNDLQDAYLAVGGQEDAEEGYTWVQQVHPRLNERYGYTRMGKVFFCRGVKLKNLRMIGVGVKVKEYKWKVMEFVTNDYGLMVDVIID
ncbi:MAG: hypothetical protein Q9210_004839 [Variospora velana]